MRLYLATNMDTHSRTPGIFRSNVRPYCDLHAFNNGHRPWHYPASQSSSDYQQRSGSISVHKPRNRGALSRRAKQGGWRARVRRLVGHQNPRIQVLSYMLDLSPTSCITLRRLRLLCRSVRSSLPILKQLHRKTKLPLFPLLSSFDLPVRSERHRFLHSRNTL